MSAGVTLAHDPAATLTCSDADPSVPVLTLNMTDYNPDYTNTVSASIDGVSVLATTTFGDTYTGSFPGGDPTVGHTAEVIVTAGDDPQGTDGYTKTFELSVGPCQDAPSSPPSTPPSSAPSSSPSGGVEAATATPPATATVDPTAPTGTSSGFGFLMILFAVVALVVGFAPVGSRRKVSAKSSTRRR